MTVILAMRETACFVVKALTPPACGVVMKESPSSPRMRVLASLAT
jgi:hypothetical protein